MYRWWSGGRMQIERGVGGIRNEVVYVNEYENTHTERESGGA